VVCAPQKLEGINASNAGEVFEKPFCGAFGLTVRNFFREFGKLLCTKGIVFNQIAFNGSDLHSIDVAKNNLRPLIVITVFDRNRSLKFSTFQ